MLWVQKKAAISSERGLDQQEGDSEQDVVMRGGSEKRSDNKKSDLELYAFILEARNVAQNNQSVKKVSVSKAFK